MRFLITCCLSLAFSGTAFAGMSATVDWGPTKKCFDSKSPPISFSGVPDGTVKLDIRMMDMYATDFMHGGGKVTYSGEKSLPYGAFRYKGPCPPTGKHKYRFTIKAFDAKGKTLATAQAEKMFP